MYWIFFKKNYRRVRRRKNKICRTNQKKIPEFDKKSIENQIECIENLINNNLEDKVKYQEVEIKYMQNFIKKFKKEFTEILKNPIKYSFLEPLYAFGEIILTKKVNFLIFKCIIDIIDISLGIYKNFYTDPWNKSITFYKHKYFKIDIKIIFLLVFFIFVLFFIYKILLINKLKLLCEDLNENLYETLNKQLDNKTKIIDNEIEKQIEITEQIMEIYIMVNIINYITKKISEILIFSIIYIKIYFLRFFLLKNI